MSKDCKVLKTKQVIFDELIRIISKAKLDCGSEDDIKLIVKRLELYKTELDSKTCKDNIVFISNVVDKFIKNMERSGKDSVLCEKLDKYNLKLKKRLETLSPPISTHRDPSPSSPVSTHREPSPSKPKKRRTVKDSPSLKESIPISRKLTLKDPTPYNMRWDVRSETDAFNPIPGLFIVSDKHDFRQSKDIYIHQMEELSLTHLSDKTSHFERHAGPRHRSVGYQVPPIPQAFSALLDGLISKELVKANLMISKYDMQWDDINGRMTSIDSLNKITVDSYMPGEGFSPHIDPPDFGPIVVIMTLASGRLIRFINQKTKEKVDVYLNEGSLCIISGEARNIWKYEMASRLTDTPEGRTKRIKRDKIYSVKFHSGPTLPLST